MVWSKQNSSKPSKPSKGALAMNKLQNNKSGFTIIEVLIVLAIAGLIMLIVFLAVPALQRNSRNTQYRNDAAAILGATNEFISNNNGQLPGNGANAFGSADPTTIGQNAKTKSLVWIVVQQGNTSATASFQSATIVKGVKCGTGSGDSYSLTSSSPRSIAVVYPIENSSGNVVAQCTES